MRREERRENKMRRRREKDRRNGEDPETEKRTVWGDEYLLQS